MVSVVICTYNRSRSLKITLESLARASIPPHFAWELITVDNNSSDDTRLVVEEFARASGLNVRYIFEGKQGKSNALNAGVGAARGEIIAFIDDDVTVDRNWLLGLRRAFDDELCLGVGGRIVPVWTDPVPPWIEVDGPYSATNPIGGLNLGEEPKELKQVAPHGANMAFRKAAFEKYGLFRTDLGPIGPKRIYCEDVEFGSRLLKAGDRVLYVPTAIVYLPVQAFKLTKPYFLSWYFEAGQSSLKAEGIPERTACCFGVPRYLLRDFLEAVFKWALSVDGRRRFYYRVEMCKVAGRIVGARRWSHERGRRNNQPNLSANGPKPASTASTIPGLGNNHAER